MLIEQRLGAVFLRTLRSTLLLLKHLLAARRHLDDELRLTRLISRFGEDLVVEFTDLYCDLNYLHPFREGNGRIQRLFLSMLVNSLGKSLNFSQIDADYLMIATIKSVSGDIFMLRDIFREYITQN